jgi:hypothetical protein
MASSVIFVIAPPRQYCFLFLGGFQTKNVASVANAPTPSFALSRFALTFIYHRWFYSCGLPN